MPFPIIHPDSKLKLAWTMLFIASMVYTVTVVPYSIAFLDGNFIFILKIVYKKTTIMELTYKVEKNGAIIFFLQHSFLPYVSKVWFHNRCIFDLFYNNIFSAAINIDNIG